MTADGSVYEEVVERDADGKPVRTRWVGAIDLGRGPDGRRRRKKVVGQGKTARQQKADAARRLRKLQQHLEEGLDVSASPTVGQR